MDILNVMGSPDMRLWLAQSTVLFFLVSGVALLAVGVSLIVNSAGALRLFGSMNRWVSMRRTAKLLEIPRDTRQTVQQYRYWFAAIFVAGGAFATYGLLTQFDANAVLFMLNPGFLHPDTAVWLLDSLRWLLIVGNLLAIVAGILLAFSPQTVIRIEARGGHWYSERRITKGGDQQNLKLDAWVEAHPRPAGWSIVFFALVLLAAFGLLLPKLW